MNKAAGGAVSRVAGLIKYKYTSTDCTELPSPLFKQNMNTHCIMHPNLGGHVMTHSHMKHIGFMNPNMNISN